MSGVFMSILKKVSVPASHWSGDDRATLSVFFAVALAPLAMIVAMTVDYSSVSRMRQTLQSAADSAVLAASRLNDADDARVATAVRVFNGLLSPSQLAAVTSATFTMDNGANTITANISASVPTFMPKIVIQQVSPLTVNSASAVAKPEVKQLDVVMCIDATGSMSNTLNAVKTNALNFESNLNSELTRRGIVAFDAMRVRVVYYRDFGGNNRTGAPINQWVWTGSTWVLTTITTADPNYWRGVGDTPPIKESAFFSLPDNRSNFSAYVNPETASGGGDGPESGLECVNSSMASAWARPGDPVAGNARSLDAIYPLVVVWTDAPAHRPSYSVSLKNPDYPSAAVMPRSYAALAAKWADPAIIDQNRKMLVFFGNPDNVYNDNDGPADGWLAVKAWPGFILGGTLSDGNSRMVSKLADAIASRVRQPTLTH